MNAGRGKESRRVLMLNEPYSSIPSNATSHSTTSILPTLYLISLLSALRCSLPPLSSYSQDIPSRSNHIPFTAVHSSPRKGHSTLGPATPSDSRLDLSSARRSLPSLYLARRYRRCDVGGSTRTAQTVITWIPHLDQPIRDCSCDSHLPN
jgi:hypothetical protein